MTALFPPEQPARARSFLALRRRASSARVRADRRRHCTPLLILWRSVARQPGTNRIVGAMQLYSKDKNVSQPIEGHAAAFASITLEGATTPSTLFTFATKTAAGAKVRIISFQPPSPPPPLSHTASSPFLSSRASGSDLPCGQRCGGVHGSLRCSGQRPASPWAARGPVRRLTVRDAAPSCAAACHRGAAGHQGGGHGALRQEGDGHLLPARGGARLPRRDADQRQVQHDLHGDQGSHGGPLPSLLQSPTSPTPF